MKQYKPLTTSSEWTFELIQEYTEHIERIAKEKYDLDLYPNSIEIIGSEQMLDAYSSHAMPIMYNHWTFGKSFVSNHNSYKKGYSGLAYEVVINSSPCIAYLMEENTMLTQILVIAHACVSGDTEYLSPTGWKRIEEYDGGYVGQFSKDGTVSFVKPKKYIKNKTDKFLYIKGTRIEQKITPDHRVIFVNGNKNIVEITGDELKLRHDQKTRGFNGKFITGFNIIKDSKLNLTDDEIRLHIAIKADGSFTKRIESDHFNCVDHDRIRFHLKKPRKIERLENILNSLNISYKKDKTYGGRYSIIFNYNKGLSKRYTSEWYNASVEQLELISEEVLNWDGCVSTKSYSSAHKEDIDFIQYVWSSTGKHTHTSTGKRAYCVTYSNQPLAGIGGVHNKTTIEEIETNDNAYCFTVDSGMFVIRYNDRISVTGNCVGHNYVYKNNYMFKEWTDAEAILDYLKFAKKYIADCEEKYGYEEVEKFLDACMTWQFYGVSKYKRPDDLNKKQQKERDKKRRQMMHEDAHEIWSTVPDLNKDRPDEIKKEKFPKHPEENILYFLEKNTPKIDEWKQEIIRIVRKIGQYFYPQLQAKVVHEGTATYWHYTIVNDLYEMGLIDDGFMVEFLALHTNVLNQPGGSAMNPYALGFFILKDIERICTEPTEEDYEWFPDIAGNGKPIETIKWASTNFKDESFIQQFLSPNAIRHFKMFSVEDDSEKPYYLVNDIHDKNGFKAIRERLARQYNLSSMIPEIQIENVDAWGDRSITLNHTMYNGIYLDVKETVEALKHLRYIWGYDVILVTKDEHGTKHLTYIISEDDIDIIDHMAEEEDDEEDQIALAFQGLYGGYIP